LRFNLYFAPDTPALRAAFGVPSGQQVGCGFPVAHLLALFSAATGSVNRRFFCVGYCVNSITLPSESG